MGTETVAKSIVVDRRTGQPKIILRKFDPNALGASHDFGQMLNAAEASEIDHEGVTEEKREQIAKIVMSKIHQWGLFKYLGKRGEMGNHYRLERVRETTGPGLKRVSDKNLDVEMDSVKVLVLCNPIEPPARKDFTNDKSYEKEFRRRKVRIDLPPITGHPKIHVLPQACLAFSLLAEGMLRRNFEGIRYEIYDENDERHRVSSRKFRMAQDGRTMLEDEDVVADLWVSAVAMSQEEIDESLEEEVEAEPFEAVGGLQEVPESVPGFGGPADYHERNAAANAASNDLADVPAELVKDFESAPEQPTIPPESDEWKEHGVTFQIIYNRVEAGEKIKPVCDSMDFCRTRYYRLQKEHEARMEAINGPQTTDEPSGSDGSAEQHQE